MTTITQIPRRYQGEISCYVLNFDRGVIINHNTDPKMYKKVLGRDLRLHPKREFFFEFKGVNEEGVNYISKILYLKSHKRKAKLERIIREFLRECQKEGFEGLLTEPSLS